MLRYESDTPSRPGRLILLRHGQSASNANGCFTGWTDVALTVAGEAQAICASRLLLQGGVLPDVVHTSVLRRAIRTADLVLDTLDRSWIKVHRSWRLNERHYGALTGRPKKLIRFQAGEQVYSTWRNSLTVAPPPMPAAHVARLREDPRYAGLPIEAVPATESLGDTADRVRPYWRDVVSPDLASGRTVLVVAHGNSLRALMTILDQLNQDELSALRVRPGCPVVYTFDPGLRPVRRGGEPLEPSAA
jgi:2,3-bisphosphoglycerate-dependent phosphoglycerate mutase